MNSHKLQLDFRHARPSWPWAGPLLLLIALAFAADAAFSYRQLARATSENQALVAKHDRRAAKPAKNASPEEITLARETMQRLSMPWDKLFGALESAASEQVALLAIEPDPRGGTVTISGDSKDYLAALTYVLNLSRAPALSRVQLLRHELRQNDPQKAVAFSVSAAWANNEARVKP